jgi:hypothetical protein
MSMALHLWSRAAKVHQDFDARHGAGTLPGTFMWAIWAAEGSEYLEELDAAVWPGAPRGDVVDISHVRWATANAITAIDLCAATIGHLFPSSHGERELSLRDFDPALKRKPKAAAAVEDRRNGLSAPFLQWVDDTLADQRYVDLHSARNPFTHSWLNRHLFAGTEDRGHPDRTQFEVRGTSVRMNARVMVVTSASLALDRVRAFVDVVDKH